MKIAGFNISGEDVGKIILSGIAFKFISQILGATTLSKYLQAPKRKVKEYKKPSQAMLIHSYYYDWKDELYTNIKDWKNNEDSRQKISKKVKKESKKVRKKGRYYKNKYRGPYRQANERLAKMRTPLRLS